MRHRMMLGTIVTAATTTVMTTATVTVMAGQPQYSITDLGIVTAGDFGSQGLGSSPGGIAFGTSLAGSGSAAFTWTPGTGQVALPNPAGRAFSVANGANDAGLVVGTGSTTFFGSGAVPVLWAEGVAAPLDIIAGLGVGRANDVNASGVVVGSNGGGVQEAAVFWSDGQVNQITATTAGGASMTTAFRVNDSGLAVGTGIDPNNAARNVGLLYDIKTGELTEIPPLAGQNGAIAFDVSQNGFVVGSSSLNQSGSAPFIWSEATGTVAIDLPAGASIGSARGVNSDGWVVGIASSAFALPFLNDGTQTYLLQDLIEPGTGWDISMNTSSGALGISEDGSIVGTGLLNGEVRAFRMTLVEDTCPADWNADGSVNIFDVVAFITDWNNTVDGTDFNGDGSINIIDVVAFITAWNVGCS
jgi:uncharacterized membrane protein